MNPGFEVKEKLSRLQDALLSAHPTMPVLLRDIHNHLRQDPAIVSLLSEEEIAIIISGLQRQTGVEIATAGIKSPKISKAALKNITVDDL